MVLLLNYYIVGGKSLGCSTIENWTTVALLKDAIKTQNLVTIRCDAAKLQLFLAKTPERSWLTENDVISGASDMSAMVELKFGNTPLRAYGLSEQGMQVGVLDAVLAARSAPVHVLVKVPQQPQPTLTQPRAAPKLRWRPAVEIPTSLDCHKFEQAVKQLCLAHKSTFIGANFHYRGDAWPIALADNEHGLKQSELGRQYIQWCREQWPEGVLGPDGFDSSLCACRTIVVDIDQGLFVDAWDGKATLLEVALDRAMNTALAKAVVAQLEMPDGLELPRYLSAPKSVNAQTFVYNLVRDLGPVFIALNEIGRGFSSEEVDSNDAKVETKAYQLFLSFCSSVLQCWLGTPQVYFVLQGYAPFLRHVEPRERRFRFVRLDLY